MWVPHRYQGPTVGWLWGFKFSGQNLSVRVATQERVYTLLSGSARLGARGALMVIQAHGHPGSWSSREASC